MIEIRFFALGIEVELFFVPFFSGQKKRERKARPEGARPN